MPLQDQIHYTRWQAVCKHFIRRESRRTTHNSLKHSHLDQQRQHSFAFDTSSPTLYNPAVHYFFNSGAVSGFSARETLNQSSENKERSQFMKLSLNVPVTAAGGRRKQ
jgi:hypothetical protein